MSDPNPRAGAPSSLRAYLLLTLTALCWGGNAIFGRLAVGEISPIALVTLRWASVLLLLIIFAHRHAVRDWPEIRKHLPYLVAMGALGYTGFNALFYVAAHSTTAVNIGIIQGAIPVFVLVGAFLAYRTQVFILQAAGVLLTIFGVAIVGFVGDLDRLVALTVNFGDGLMVIACMLYAGYTVGLRRRPAISSLGLFSIMAASAFVVSLPLLAGEVALGQFQAPTLKGWGVVALVTLFPSFVAQLSFMKGVELIGPGRAGIFVNLVPIFASIMAVAFLGEPFELFHASALALVLGGIWIAESGKAA